MSDLKETYKPNPYGGTGWADGAGAVSDVTNTVDSIQHGDAVGIGIAGAASALDALALVADPLAGLLSAGIGWLMEHLDFLRKPLDIMCGDPGAIQAESNTWKNIGNEMTKVKDDYERSISADVPQWQSPAGEAYRRKAKDLATRMGGFSEAANGASIAVTVAGALVGTERGIIRDLISTFVAKMIERALIALAASFFTFGGAAAAFIADAVAEGAILAGKIAAKIAKVLEKLASLLSKLGKLGQQVAKLVNKLGHGIEEAGKDMAKESTKHAGSLLTDNLKNYTKGAAGSTLKDPISLTAGIPPAATEGARQTREALNREHEYQQQQAERAREPR